jgi:hypothetical protein
MAQRRIETLSRLNDASESLSLWRSPSACPRCSAALSAFLILNANSDPIAMGYPLKRGECSLAPVTLDVRTQGEWKTCPAARKGDDNDQCLPSHHRVEFGAA